MTFVCDSSTTTGVSAEEMNSSVVCIPFGRATEDSLGHSSIPRRYTSMRATRRQGVLGVVRCGTKPSSRVRARAPSVQHLLRGGYKRDLRAFQGRQRHHGCFGAPEEGKWGGGAGGSNCRRITPGDAALRHALCWRCRGRLAITRATEKNDGDNRDRVRGVWPHRIGGQD